MREQVRDKGRLEHILQAIDKVFEFTKDVKREDFKKDSILYFAIVKNIEIIGEASYMLSLDFNILDYRKIQDTILLEVLTFHILREFKDLVDGLKNMLQATSIPNLLSHISESCHCWLYVLRKIIKYLQ